MLKCLKLNFMIYIPLRSPISMFDNARITKHYRVGRHIYIYKAVGSNKNIITNSDATDNSCIDTNPYFIANGRNTFVLSSIRLTYNYSFMDIAVTAYSYFGVYCNIISMSYINTPPIWFPALISRPLRLAQRRNKAL